MQDHFEFNYKYLILKHLENQSLELKYQNEDGRFHNLGFHLDRSLYLLKQE